MQGRRERLPLGLLLTLLLAAQVVATDLYLPAMPHIAADLAVGAGKVQSTLTVFVLAFGLSQLLAGPLVDRYGRRATLLWGLGLYVGAAVGAAMASVAAAAAGVPRAAGMRHRRRRDRGARHHPRQP